MLSSINPLVERGRHNRFALTAAAYVVASTAGGAVAGVLAAALGDLSGSAVHWTSAGRAAVVAVVLAVALALDWQVLGARLPTTRRQVNEDWLNRYRNWVYGAGFGFQLGLGVVTIVTTAMVYAFLALVFALGRPLAGASIGAVFGLVRALPLLAGARIHDTASLRSFHRRLAAMAKPAARAGMVTNGVLLAASIAAVAR